MLALITLHSHAQRTAKSLEDRFRLMVRIHPAQVVDMERHQGVIDETLEELLEQVHVEAADVARVEVRA